MTDSLTYTLCEKLEIEICRTLYCIYMRQICIIPPVYTDFIHWIYTSCRLHIYSGRIAHLYRTGCICISDGLHVYIGQIAYTIRADCLFFSGRMPVVSDYQSCMYFYIALPDKGIWNFTCVFRASCVSVLKEWILAGLKIQSVTMNHFTTDLYQWDNLIFADKPQIRN